MKKFLNKKVNVFGKAVPVFAFVILGLALTSAALVPYLSGLVTGTTTVSSPVYLGAQEGEGAILNLGWDGENTVPNDGYATGEGALALVDANGGYEDSFWLKIDNNADSIVDKYLVFEVSNDVELTEEELTSIMGSITVYDWEHSGVPTTKRSGEYDTGSLNITCESNTCRIVAPLWLWEEAVDDTDLVFVHADLNFPLNAIGTYNIEAAVMDDPEGELPTA